MGNTRKLVGFCNIRPPDLLVSLTLHSLRTDRPWSVITSNYIVHHHLGMSGRVCSISILLFCPSNFPFSSCKESFRALVNLCNQFCLIIVNLSTLIRGWINEWIARFSGNDERPREPRHSKTKNMTDWVHELNDSSDSSRAAPFAW